MAPRHESRVGSRLLNVLRVLHKEAVDDLCVGDGLQQRPLRKFEAVHPAALHHWATPAPQAAALTPELLRAEAAMRAAARRLSRRRTQVMPPPTLSDVVRAHFRTGLAAAASPGLAS